MSALTLLGGARVTEREHLRIVTLGNDPAAGAELAIVVPGHRIWQLVTVTFELATDATVANRSVVVRVDDQQNIVWQQAVPVAQAASLTRRYSFAVGFGYDQAAFVAGGWSGGFPALVLTAGMRIVTATENLQAGDNFARPALTLVEHTQYGEPVRSR